MNRKIKLVNLLFNLILFFSCAEDATDDPFKLPDNLLISVDFLGNGLVKANFTADDAVFFKANFGFSEEINEPAG